MATNNVSFTSDFSPVYRPATAKGVAAWMNSVKRVIDGHRALAHLRRVDEQTLSDIGITRQDVYAAASYAFWKDPTLVLARAIETRRKATEWGKRRNRQAV